MSSTYQKRIADIAARNVRVRLAKPRQSFCLRPQLFRAAGGKRDQPSRAYAVNATLRRRFFHDNMRIGSAESKGADRRAALCTDVRSPRRKRGINVERTCVEVDARVAALEM